MKVSEWSERHRYLSREYSAQPGRYSLDIVPYAREPLDCANDSSIRLVVLMWGSQTTKTTLLENELGYFIDAEPSPILMVQPTVEMAQAWSKERFNATVRDTPVLRDKITGDKSRISDNTIQLKTFPGGNLAIIGSNAPAGLASRPRRIVLLDEVDRFPASAGTEGDPVSLAIRRTESFHNAVIYLTSTPTIKGLSRIEKEFEQTDKRKWFVPCPVCHEFQTLKWSQLRWDDGKPETACYHCEKCDAAWNDEQRVAAIRSGEWRATAAFNGKRGYYLNGLYSPFKAKRGFQSRLHQMAQEFLEAKAGGVEQIKTWTNTFLAETWQEEGDSIEPDSLLAKCEPYSPAALPNQVGLIIGGADVQKDRIELELIGLGLDDETWGVEVIKTYGETEKPETWNRFASELNRKFRREDGIELGITAIAVDFHYKPATVKNFARGSGLRTLVLPVIGIGADQPALVFRRQSQDKFTHWTITTDRAKDIVFARLRIADPGPRFCHFPRGFGYDESWFRQLTSERAITKYTRGFPKRIYEKSQGVRNEALDMRVYALACIEIINPDIRGTLATLQKKPGPKPQHPAMPKQGWVNNWR